MSRISIWTALLAATSTLSLTEAALGQTAPAPRAVITETEAPEALGSLLGTLTAGETQVSIPGAQWLQLRFAEFDLGATGNLIVATPDGESQIFTQESLAAWDGRSETA